MALVKRTHTKLPPISGPDDTSRYIELTLGMFAIVDEHNYERLNKYYWRAIKSHNCWYAVRRRIRNGRTWTMRMHRQIMRTPIDQVCHHKNHNTLDNRRCNLLNLYQAKHELLHGIKTR